MTADRLFGGCPGRIHKDVNWAAKGLGPGDEGLDDIAVAYVEMRGIDLDALSQKNGPHPGDLRGFRIGCSIPAAARAGPNIRSHGNTGTFGGECFRDCKTLACEASSDQCYAPNEIFHPITRPISANSSLPPALQSLYIELVEVMQEVFAPRFLLLRVHHESPTGVAQ